jgi:hypothetical protein
MGHRHVNYDHQTMGHRRVNYDHQTMGHRRVNYDHQTPVAGDGKIQMNT